MFQNQRYAHTLQSQAGGGGTGSARKLGSLLTQLHGRNGGERPLPSVLHNLTGGRLALGKL